MTAHHEIHKRINGNYQSMKMEAQKFRQKQLQQPPHGDTGQN
jgi:hypothetical protein